MNSSSEPQAIYELESRESIALPQQEVLMATFGLEVLKGAFLGCTSIELTDPSKPWGTEGSGVFGTNNVAGFTLHYTFKMIHREATHYRFFLSCELVECMVQVSVMPSINGGSILSFKAEVEQKSMRKVGMLAQRLFWQVYSNSTLRRCKRILEGERLNSTTA